MALADLNLAQRAEQQFGIFTRDDALEAGLTDGQIDWRIATGRWVRVQPRTFRMAGAPLTWWGALRAATVSAQRPIAISHETALDALGLGSKGPSAPIEVTTNWSGPMDLYGVAVHRSRTLEPRDVRACNGVPVTTPERSIIDVAGRLSLVARYSLVDEAICASRTRRARIHARASELRQGRAGVSSIVNITAGGAREAFRSFLEREAGRTIRCSDLPQPLWNAPVRHKGRLIGVVDALWERALFGVEFDGLRFHLPPARRAKDVARDRRLLVEAGITVVRFTYAEVMQEPAAMVAQIRRALNASGVSVGPGGAG